MYKNEFRQIEFTRTEQRRNGKCYWWQLDRESMELD